MSRIRLSNIGKTYRLGEVDVPALSNVSLEVSPNCFTVLSGPSGSGKTTLLNVIGGIDKPDTGELNIGGQDIKSLKDDALTEFRLRHVGFIFQTFNLLQVLSAYENVEYPLRLTQQPKKERHERVMHLLSEVGLADRAQHKPNQLSGGQRQRVAIARALALKPQIILADEPTANLDSATGDSILALLRKIQKQHKVSVIFSSHDPKILAEADDIVSINDGRVVSIERRGKEIHA